ncbi:hypothetical protein A2442_04115 [Candidatus Campbellbacteria bacterium RIFOXYC2_FULL_35_25]|uniref:PDZ domain-containing protein n=1 Tax=Candidatus Campbellbacteria bacterium RIFOXYC2_FULL_35_25 TaxID=1797582 RepID=A0A1F5EKK5_9BACT|nr:MAG: hypothetical protein A2442_04115 [Candidatus Campbellbacteria bacterium RIFOXYC2_FULL_35_25]
MTILLFIIILAVLILVHELGHFIVAKKTGMRVDEFGIGFPPRIFAFKKGETEYSINLIPLGGFVKIFGETPDEDSIDGSDSSRSMVNKPKWAQALTISAGVICNLIFAWLLISIGFMSGLPSSVDQFVGVEVKDANVVLVDVLPDSPAFEAGLEVGDKLMFMGAGESAIQDFTQTEMQEFIAGHGGEELTVLYKRGKEEVATAFITPKEGIIADKFAIGISSDVVGVVRLPIHRALWEGLKLTISLIGTIAVGLFGFIASLIKGTGSFSDVSGPVGIVGLVGDAASFGFIYLLSFTAFISINLAVINFIPFPALDGGRLLFIFIEAVTRKTIKPVIANTLNLVGFALLMLLMVAVTYNDIIKLF